MAQQSTGNTGTRDVTYDIVSILYHALQGADLYEQYIDDAEQSGDEGVAQFFRDIRDENKRRADRAKELLSQRLSKSKDQAATR